MSSFKEWLMNKLRKKSKTGKSRPPVKFLVTAVVFDNMRLPPVMVPVTDEAHSYFTAISLTVSEINKKVGGQYISTAKEMMGYYAGQAVSDLLHTTPITEGVVQGRSKTVVVARRAIQVQVHSILAMSDSDAFNEFMRHRQSVVVSHDPR